MTLQIEVSLVSLIFQKRFTDAFNTLGMPYIASTACTTAYIATSKQKMIISKITKRLTTEIILRCTPCYCISQIYLVNLVSDLLKYTCPTSTVLIVHRIVLFWEPDRCFQDGRQEHLREVGTYFITIPSVY